MNLGFEERNSPSRGFIKVWQYNPETGKSEILVDKNNTILYTGSDILAKALSGIPNYGISHFYLGYSNDVNTPGSTYTISKSNSAFPYTTNANLGYLRVPLTFPVSFTKDTSNNYSNNIAVYTIVTNNASSYVVPALATLTNGVSEFFEAGLVVATNSSDTVSNHSGDKVYARVSFQPITYDSAFNLTVGWGVAFTS